MQIDIITGFPAMISAPLEASIIGRAVSRNIVKLNIYDLRAWTSDKHRTIDDMPYGGGAGMVYKVEPLYKSLEEIFEKSRPKPDEVLLTSPRGQKFNQDEAIKLSLAEHIVIICGHYKGVDERIKSFFPIREVSIGDYVLSGGEIPAMVIVDTLIRLVPGALNDISSAMSDSFSDYLLDCDYYTRPENFKGVTVPKILLSGDHKKIETWRLNQREALTKKRRPDLYKKYIETTKLK
jgi:tRNA (guanine37-N1)-methyltransferase